MEKVYGEADVTWSSIEKYYSYDKVTWSVDKNGIPVYSLLGENNQKIKIDINKFLN
jgi:S-adenosylhomocysteine hydrolase